MKHRWASRWFGVSVGWCVELTIVCCSRYLKIAAAIPPNSVSQQAPPQSKKVKGCRTGWAGFHLVAFCL